MEGVVTTIGEKWAAAMRRHDYAAAWDISHQILEQRSHGRSDDPGLAYHLRWVWDGRDYRDRHCLVRCYHGLGDTIQFARFLPMLAARAASLRVEVQPRLIPVLEHLAQPAEGPRIAFIPFDPARPAHRSECDLEVTELAFALRAMPADAPMPYLPAVRAVLPRGTVGLCYGAGDWDTGRSLPPELMAPLCGLAPCVTLMTEPTSLDVLNRNGCPFDMAATAALVGGSDLVITVDTMIAHLAGAMGRPTWLLLKAEADWRWPVEDRHTPWYPFMRIYAQPSAGDWASVLAEVRRDLAIFSSRSSRKAGR